MMFAFWPFLAIPVLVIATLVWSPELIRAISPETIHLTDLPKIKTIPDLDLLEKEEKSQEISFDLTRIMVGFSAPKLVIQNDPDTPPPSVSQQAQSQLGVQ